MRGKVLAVEGEKVKLHLNVDKNQNEASEDPIVTGCVRTNRRSCAKTADTTNRYFETEHGSEIEMTPEAVNIKGSNLASKS